MRQRKWFLCGKTVNRGIKTNYQETFESGIPGIIGVLGIIGKVAAGNKMAAILNGVFRLLAFRNGRELQNEWTFESGVPGIVGDYREGGRQKSRWRPF